MSLLSNLEQNPSKLKKISKLVHAAAVGAGSLNLVKNLIKPPKVYQPIPKKTDPALRQALTKKHRDYALLMQDTYDENGFVLTHECDSLLFSALVGCDPLVPINIEAARNKDGLWSRRPVDSQGCDTCYPKHSKSTISRDMFTGLFWYIWRHKRLDLAEQLYAQGEARDWIMGQGDPGRIVLSPNLRAILAEIIYQLGGKNRPLVRAIPNVFGKDTGYAAHLDVLVAGLMAELQGGATQQVLDLLEHHALRQPKNALYTLMYHRYVTPNQNTATKLLLDETYFPDDRLPERGDRKEAWLWQRDASDTGWRPDPKAHRHKHPVHPGADLVFAAFLILEDEDEN
jgi:hypothetical protein